MCLAFLSACFFLRHYVDTSSCILVDTILLLILLLKLCWLQNCKSCFHFLVFCPTYELEKQKGNMSYLAYKANASTFVFLCAGERDHTLSLLATNQNYKLQCLHIISTKWGNKGCKSTYKLTKL